MLSNLKLSGFHILQPKLKGQLYDNNIIKERTRVLKCKKLIVTYPVQAVFAVFPIKVLETFHVLLVNNFVEELIDCSHGDGTDSRPVCWF